MGVSEMKETRPWIRFLTVLVGGLVLAGCMDPTLSGSGMVSSSLSIADAPLGVSEIDIRIRGQDFDPINLTVNRNIDALILELPVGKNRLFEGRAGTYFARTVAPVTPNGANVGLSFWPVLIVPDTNNSRLVQVWRPDQPVWEANSYDGQPVDIDFDQGGRVIVADAINGILRFDSIYDGTPEFLSSVSSITSVAVDRVRSIIYFVGMVGQFGLFSMDYQGNVSAAPLGGVGLSTAERVAIGSDGILYVYDSELQEIVKFNPGTEEEIIRVGVPYGTLEDLESVDGFLYVALSGVQPGQAPIVRLNLDLSFAGSTGTIAGNPANAAPGEFYGPVGFVTDRRGLLVVKDLADGYSRLVFLNPNNPGAWAAYGSNGSGEGQFSF